MYDCAKITEKNRKQNICKTKKHIITLQEFAKKNKKQTQQTTC